ncbi:MAG: DUF1570 domain-containing protein [Thermoguttaceae bacterium]
MIEGETTRRAFLCALALAPLSAAFGFDLQTYETDEWFRLAQKKCDELVERFNAVNKENNIHDSAGRPRLFKSKICAPFIICYDVSDEYAGWLSSLLGEVTKAYERFCEKLGVETTLPVYALTVVVFATREGFDAFATQLQGPGFLEQENKPVGFYHQSSKFDGSVIYDMTSFEATRETSGSRNASKNESKSVSANTVVGADRGSSRVRAAKEARAMKSRLNAGDNVSTIVHEIAHQLSYRTGLFNFGAPDWVVEGLATTFETPNEDAALGWRFRGSFPVNESRLRAFVEYFNDDFSLSSIKEVVTSDSFEEELRDEGYATAWALFYFALRKKPKELRDYLERIKKREGRRGMSAEERMEEFVASFGDPDVFGRQFVKFIRDLNSR